MLTFDAKECISIIWDKINKAGLLNGGSGSVHSLLADQNGCRIFEEYAYPYSKNKMHRMFSVTKSFVSIAIGFLIEEGKIDPLDRIVTFFPEYEPEEGFHPYLQNMTIQDMLCMQTCHTSTTYQFHGNLNWVKSFFVTPPSHRSGKVFKYDTSAAHTLAALVKKLTGMGVLDYLRTRIPAGYLFSKDAYVIKDPFGDEIGGSGLMCYSEDLLKVGRFVMNELLKSADSEKDIELAFCLGHRDKEIRTFSDYIKEAVSFKTPNTQTGQVMDERQGYGYQFWRIRGGFCMYGMGGQYALFYPQYDLVIVTTADLQNIKGGTQPLLDIIHDTLSDYAPCFEKYEKDIYEALEVKPKFSELNYTYKIHENGSGFESFSLVYKSEKGQNPIEAGEGDAGGLLSIKQKAAGGSLDYIIPFDLETESEEKLPLIDPGTMEALSYTTSEVPFISKASWISEDTLYIEISLAGEEVGSIHITMNISETNLTVQMKKVVEAKFEDFTGFLEGVAAR